MQGTVVGVLLTSVHGYYLMENRRMDGSMSDGWGKKCISTLLRDGEGVKVQVNGGGRQRRCGLDASWMDGGQYWLCSYTHVPGKPEALCVDHHPHRHIFLLFNSWARERTTITIARIGRRGACIRYLPDIRWLIEVYSRGMDGWMVVYLWILWLLLATRPF